MKKLLSLLTIFSLFLTACSFSNDTTETSPINFQTELTTEDIAYYTEGDDIVTILNSTPYYISPQTLSLPAFKEFNELKKAKIQSAQNLTDELYTQTKQFQSQLDPFKIALHQFVSVAYEHEPKVADFAKGVAAQFMESNIEIAAAQARIEASEKQTSNDQLAESFLEYQKTSAVLQLTEVLYQDLGFIFANSSQLASAFENHQNPEIVAAYQVLNSEMTKINSLNDSLTAINQKSAELDHALKQIETADYQMGLASLAFIRAEIPAIKTQIATIQPSENFSAEEIEFTREYADQFESFATDLEMILAKSDKSNLLIDDQPKETTFIPTAQADFTDNLSAAFNTLKAGVTATGKVAKLTWNGAKTTVGVGLDILDAEAKTVFDIGFGLYAGEDIKSISNRVVDNIARIKENFDQGASGSKVLATAGKYLEGTEAAADKFFADGVAEYTGKGNASWLVGKVAKITTGMFTGFGKGVYKVANTQSTTADVVEGSIDIGFSFIGGTKVIFKGSQAISGSKTGLKALGSKGINFVKSTWNKAKLSDLRSLYKEALEQGGEEAAELIAKITAKISSREALAETLKQTTKTINDEIITGIKSAGKTVLDNLKGAKGSYDEFVKTMYKDDTLLDLLGGLKGAIDDVAGTTLTDYFDNLVGSVIDDALKGQIKILVESQFGKFGGTYSGAVNIEGISIPISVEVDGSALIGNIKTTINFVIFDEPVKIAIAATITGTIDESAAVKASFTGAASAEGKSVGFSGTFDGTINETALNATNIIFVGPDDSFGPLTATLTKHQ